MRTIVHLSDLHFGQTDPVIVAAVRQEVVELRPDLIAISGDFTQRARRSEFAQARDFLASLPGPKLVVPGNHDVPLWNVLARFAFPLANYRRFIAKDLAPRFDGGEFVAVGINTARSFTWKDGRINLEQAEAARAALCPFGDEVLKVVVTHHPFDLSEAHGADELVGRAGMALERLAKCGADLLLAGHLHEAYTGGTARRYRLRGYSALVVQAGTATSTRLRNSANSFNILRLDPPRVAVEVVSWNAEAGRFVVTESKRYERFPGRGFERLRDESAR